MSEYQGDRRDDRREDRRGGRRDGGTPRGGRGYGAPRDGGGGGGSRGDRRHDRPTADLPRLTAHRVLSAVETDDAYANLVLPHALADAGLDGRDAAFVTEIVYGTLRLQRRYDAMIVRGLEGRSLPSLQPALRIALRMGAHQLHAMRIPERAAVYETVNLVRVVAGHAPVALANAVLRKVSQRSTMEWEETLLAEEGVGTWESHPEWIVSSYRQALALEGNGAQLGALLEANNTPAPVTLVARPGLADREELLERLPAARTPYSPVGLLLRGGSPGEFAEVRSSHVGVQDEGSQLMAYLMADAPLEGQDEQWLDMTAGPGGKAALLGALARQRGAHLLANEVQEHRTELVRRAVRPLRDTVTVVTGDGREIGGSEPGRYDRILLDAPCTGLGSLRRRPESRWRRTEADLRDLTVLQRDLLDSAITALRPGGVLAYVTCSPHLAETVTQVSHAVRRHPVSLLDAPAELAPWGVALERAGIHPLPETVQLWPHVHGTDAMFGALLRKDG
nr:rRNA small subunit methyltransferase B [Actinomycetales bacterium]